MSGEWDDDGSLKISLICLLMILDLVIKDHLIYQKHLKAPL